MGEAQGIRTDVIAAGSIVRDVPPASEYDLLLVAHRPRRNRH
jgi:hypothetical protein